METSKILDDSTNTHKRLIESLTAASKAISKASTASANTIVVGISYVTGLQNFAKLENFDDAVQMIERYYNGEGTEEEQKILSAYSQSLIEQKC